MPSFDPNNRSLIGRIAAHERWGREADRVAATAPMRAGRDQKFRDEVCASVASQGITLSDEEIEIRAKHLRKASMLRLALKSAQARANRAAE